MWGLISGAFLVVYCLISLYISKRGWDVLKDTRKIYKRIYWLFMGALVLAFPITEIGQKSINKVWITTIGWYSMLAVVYIFFSLLFVDLIREGSGLYVTTYIIRSSASGNR